MNADDLRGERRIDHDGGDQDRGAENEKMGDCHKNSFFRYGRKVSGVFEAARPRVPLPPTSAMIEQT